MRIEHLTKQFWLVRRRVDRRLKLENDVFLSLPDSKTMILINRWQKFSREGTTFFSIPFSSIQRWLFIHRLVPHRCTHGWGYILWFTIIPSGVSKVAFSLFTRGSFCSVLLIHCLLWYTRNMSFKNSKHIL